MSAWLMTLGIKLCGSCNPSISGMDVARGIADALAAAIVPYDDPCALTVLVINGCETGCVRLPQALPLHVDGLLLDRRPCADQEVLIRLAATRIFDLLGE